MYKIVQLCSGGSHLSKSHFDKLQEEFDDGWEFVAQIQQNGYDYSRIGIILKKEKVSL